MLQVDGREYRKINHLKQWKAYQKIAKEKKFKANINSVYNALLYFANECFWLKEVEIVLQDALDMAGVDKDIYGKCLTTLFENGLLDMWIKGSNRHTKARVSLAILYDLDTDKSEATIILPSELSEQVDTDKSEATIILPSELSEQVDTDKSEHLLKPLNSNSFKTQKTTNRESAFAAPSQFDVVVFFMECGFLKNEAIKFYNYYSNNDWCIKNKKIKNWQNVASTWQARKPDIEKEKYSAQKEKENSDYLKRQFKAFHCDYKPGTECYSMHKLIYAELLNEAITASDSYNWQPFRLDLSLLSQSLNIDRAEIGKSINDLWKHEFLTTCKQVPNNNRLVDIELTVWK